MRKVLSLVSLLMLLALAAVVSIRALMHPSPADMAAETKSAAPIPTSQQVPELVSPTSAASEEGQVRNYARSMAESTNYLEFARTIHDAAKSGDAEARFHLYKALEYCRSEFRFFFVRGEKRRTLDEGMAWASRRPPLDAEVARLVHQRCQQLMEPGDHGLGEPAEWLLRAMESKHPLAQVHVARNLLLQLQPAAERSSDDQAQVEAARILINDALKSREPEVIFEVGQLQYALHGEKTAEDDHQAWELAACQRGLECGPDSKLARAYCRFDTACQPFETVPDIQRRHAGNRYPARERRAREINSLIDRGEWEQLGSPFISDP